MRRGIQQGSAMLTRRPWWVRLLRRRWFQVYLVLLAASHAVIIARGVKKPQPDPNESSLTLAAMTDQGPSTSGKKLHLTIHQWKPATTSNRPPVILLHGSPSRGGEEFKHLGQRLANAGYEAIAPDLPGFGNSQKLVPSYSIVANARLMLAMMDELKIQRAHVVGWSLGGGSATYMADMAPDRIASLTLMGSIGIQEAEGSGSYFFEHTKYAMGFAGLVALPEVVPHFGLLGPRSFRYAFIRNFWDSDQRPLRAIMEKLSTPTLILHGRRDFLVPAWGAEQSHELIKTSRLVILDASHFLPLGPPMQSEAALKQVEDVELSFISRHDEPGVPALVGSAILKAEAPDADEAKIGSFHLKRDTPWWLAILIIIVATFVSEDLTVIAVGLLIVGGHMDAAVGLTGCFLGIVGGDYGLWALGRFVGRRLLRWPLVRRFVSEKAVEKWGRVLDAHPAKTVFLARCLPGTRMPTYIAAGMLAKRSHVFLFWVTVAVVIWTPLLLLLTALIGPTLLGVMKSVFHGPWAYFVAFLTLVVIVRLAAYEATHSGRQRLKADLHRLRTVEFWPMWAFYLPFVPVGIWLLLRYRGPMTFTCLNPGIPSGGGVVGESKWHILRGLSASRDITLYAVHVPAGASHHERAAMVIEKVHNDPELGGYPVILKPDHSERGHGLKLAHNDQDVIDYFLDMTRDAIAQRFHPGPNEVGILWTRVAEDGKPLDECAGRIFSITRKRFPVIEGDGKRTLEELIWDHPRYRMQAHIFLKRHEDQTDRVLAAGETMRLGVAGNHCQGTMFYDGADLITPELNAAIDRIARAFRDEKTGGGLDYGRFDLRYTTDDALRRGEGFAIVELNGTMSESTNMYDPAKSAWWTYSVLFSQWMTMFRLGLIRRREGKRPMLLRDLLRAVRSHFKGRPGSSVAD